MVPKPDATHCPGERKRTRYDTSTRAGSIQCRFWSSHCLRSGWCISYFLSTLSDFIFLEELTQGKIECFAKLQLLNDKTDQNIHFAHCYFLYNCKIAQIFWCRERKSERIVKKIWKNMIRSLVNAVVVCLRESHRCRATFRKCGGFNSLLSIILSLDQCLSFKHSDQNCDSKDINDDLSSILLLLRSVFNCLAVAMRFEPANAKFFQVSKKNLEEIQNVTAIG